LVLDTESRQIKLLREVKVLKLSGVALEKDILDQLQRLGATDKIPDPLPSPSKSFGDGTAPPSISFADTSSAASKKPFPIEHVERVDDAELREALGTPWDDDDDHVLKMLCCFQQRLIEMDETIPHLKEEEHVQPALRALHTAIINFEHRGVPFGDCRLKFAAAPRVTASFREQQATGAADAIVQSTARFHTGEKISIRDKGDVKAGARRVLFKTMIMFEDKKLASDVKHAYNNQGLWYLVELHRVLEDDVARRFGKVRTLLCQNGFVWYCMRGSSPPPGTPADLKWSVPSLENISCHRSVVKLLRFLIRHAISQAQDIKTPADDSEGGDGNDVDADAGGSDDSEPSHDDDDEPLVGEVDSTFAAVNLNQPVNRTRTAKQKDSDASSMVDADAFYEAGRHWDVPRGFGLDSTALKLCLTDESQVVQPLQHRIMAWRTET
jgi:hypothetical protein